MNTPRASWRWILLWALTAAGGGSASAALRLPALFSDNAVFQQGKPIPVWGWAEDGEEITVEFHGRKVTTVARNGAWVAKLPRQAADSIPGILLVRGRQEVLSRTNILVGEVWVGSGQSNMQWPLSRSEAPADAIAHSANSAIRLFSVPRVKAASPQDDVAAHWDLCGPATVADFSAVAYFFGRDLQAARGVPVGLIHTSWGGSPAEVWVRDSVLAADPELNQDIVQAFPARQREFEQRVADWDREATVLKGSGKTPTRPRPSNLWRPSELYNSMIYPLIPYAIAGVIWYQGESNADRAQQYSRLFPALIQSWRGEWGQGEFPFLAVQLAPWDRNRQRTLEQITATPGESDWAELRESQLLTTKVLRKVGMAVITDLGTKDDIHPPKKEPVGARLALAARAIAYGERLVYSGPRYRSMRVSRGRAILDFDSVGGGLVAQDGPLRGFQICGSDREWHWATAQIQGARVVVANPSVPQPIAVRYGWSDYPVVNLFNREGLPASPFRTDNFPMITAPKR